MTLTFTDFRNIEARFDGKILAFKKAMQMLEDEADDAPKLDEIPQGADNAIQM